MRLDPTKVRVRAQVWLVPGAEDTVASLAAKLRERGVRLLLVEHDRILVVDEED